MDPELIKNEIKLMLEKMGFGNDTESIEAHQGSTSRFSVRLKEREEGLHAIDGTQIQSTEIDNGGVAEEEIFRSGQRISSSRLLIGEQGNNLAALEHLLKKIIAKKYGESYKFTLDINDYRMRKLEDLKQDVKAAAKAVRLYRKEVPLRPMSSFERRIVHLLLAEYPDITTESIGQEPQRRVVIKPYP